MTYVFTSHIHTCTCMPWRYTHTHKLTCTHACMIQCRACTHAHTHSWHVTIDCNLTSYCEINRQLHYFECNLGISNSLGTQLHVKVPNYVFSQIKAGLHYSITHDIQCPNSIYACSHNSMNHNYTLPRALVCSSFSVHEHIPVNWF